MRLYSFAYCGLVGCFALFAPGVTQPAAAQSIAEDSHLSDTQATFQVSHAPLKLRIQPDGRVLRGPRNTSASFNWAGYALSLETYTSASFSWTVPTAAYVNYPGAPSFEDSTIWVGIGGFGSNDLIQLGTEQRVDSMGNATYQAWYELLPATEQVLPPGQYPVSPGDVMSASLTCPTCTVNVAGTWTLTMTNSTKNWTWTQDFTYKSAIGSAEWVVEAPTFNPGGIAALPNFGTLNFTNIKVNGLDARLILNSDGLQLLDQAGGFATPCEPIDGNRFLVAWGRTCPTISATHDNNDDGHSDIVWRNTSTGDTAVWLMNGGTVVSPGGIGAVGPTWSIVGQRDFNGDGKSDLLWRDTSGNTAIWFMNGVTVASPVGIGNIDPSWTVVATGDFNGDGMGDILWRDGSGNLAVWIMNGATVISNGGLGNLPLVWTLAGTGDFNGDGMADLLWRDTSGNTVIWFMNSTSVASFASLGNVSTSWQVIGIGDLNGDGFSDIVWRDTSGNTSIWLMNGATIAASGGLGVVPTTWSLAATGDYNGDGKSDLVWRDTSGNTAIWFMNGVNVASTAGLGNIAPVWVIQSVNAE